MTRVLRSSCGHATLGKYHICERPSSFPPPSGTAGCRVAGGILIKGGSPIHVVNTSGWTYAAALALAAGELGSPPPGNCQRQGARLVYRATFTSGMTVAAMTLSMFVQQHVQSAGRRWACININGLRLASELQLQPREPPSREPPVCRSG